MSDRHTGSSCRACREQCEATMRHLFKISHQTHTQAPVTSVLGACANHAHDSQPGLPSNYQMARLGPMHAMLPCLAVLQDRTSHPLRLRRHLPHPYHAEVSCLKVRTAFLIAISAPGHNNRLHSECSLYCLLISKSLLPGRVSVCV